MMIEVWKDHEGYRVLCEDPEFDLSETAFEILIDRLHEATRLDVDGDNYLCIMLDLPEEE